MENKWNKPDIFAYSVNKSAYQQQVLIGDDLKKLKYAKLY